MVGPVPMHDFINNPPVGDRVKVKNCPYENAAQEQVGNGWACSSVEIPLS